MKLITKIIPDKLSVEYRQLACPKQRIMVNVHGKWPTTFLSVQQLEDLNLKISELLKEIKKINE